MISISWSAISRERKVNNEVVASIDKCYRKQLEFSRKDPQIRSSILEINKGGHFSNPDGRVLKGIKWLLESAVK